MAIYARKSGSKELAGLLNSVVCPCNPLDGYLLIWKENVQAFVVSPPPSSLNAINNTNTFGGTNTVTVNGGIQNNTLNFKQFIAGSGIYLTQDNQSITISSNLTSDKLSVPENYRITIDNDGNSGDAKFEIWTAQSIFGGPTTINVIPPKPPVTIQYIYSGNNSGLGFFKTINGYDLLAAGYAPGMFLVVSGAGDQSGNWSINDVYNQGTESIIELTEEFIGPYGFNLGGPKTNTEFKTVELWAEDEFHLKAYSIDFDLYSFIPGMIVSISGSKNGNFDGNYKIDNVIPKGLGPLDYSVLEFSSDTPMPQTGPIEDSNDFAPTLTLTVSTFEGSTGFYVKKDGTVRANEVFISNAPSDPQSAITKKYLDNALLNSYFLSLL